MKEFLKRKNIIFSAKRYGIDALDEHWYKPFGDKVNSYFHGPKEYRISELLEGFEKFSGVR